MIVQVEYIKNLVNRQIEFTSNEAAEKFCNRVKSARIVGVYESN